MPRYKANAPFGPWQEDEEFESTDAFHAKLAAQGRLLKVVDVAPVEDEYVEVPDGVGAALLPRRKRMRRGSV